MKEYIIYLLSFILGIWFVFDGIHVLIKGKYFGPEEAGPWSKVIELIGINPYSLGIPFIFLGIFWIVAVLSLYFEHSLAMFYLSFVAILSIWYLPIGTIISIIILLLLWVL